MSGAWIGHSPGFMQASAELQEEERARFLAAEEKRAEAERERVLIWVAAPLLAQALPAGQLLSEGERIAFVRQARVLAKMLIDGGK